jgi:hypothetical protein
MQAEQVTDALRRFVLRPTEQITQRVDRPGQLWFTTSSGAAYEAKPADWLIAADAWVETAVRVVAPTDMPNFSRTYGLLFPKTGEPIFLNDVTTMHWLGSGLAGGVDPVGYAELLGELYSGDDIDQAVVSAFSATSAFRAGQLVRDVDQVRQLYPAIDPALLSAPVVRRDSDALVLDFLTYRYYLLEVRAAVDLYRWAVTGPAGEPAQWERQRVQRVEFL